jgi:soluble lytic murein transglycosylase
LSLGALVGADFVVRYLSAVLIALLGLAGGTAWVVKSEPDWYLRARYPLSYEQSIRTNARARGLDPALLASMVYVESRFDPNARSDVGAIGLMQLLPETAKGIALRTGGARFVVSDLLDPDLNIRYGSWYLDHLLDRYESTDMALAAYQAGQGNVDRWRRAGTGIEFPETRAYVSEVERIRNVYVDAYSADLGL